MPAYETLKGQLVHLNTDTMALLDDAEKMVASSDERLARWKSTCQTISEQMNEETMRVAVVGAIKSGKSTFVNTMLAGDFLKRGAGVVTSIVTRVRFGKRLRAVLYLKNWDEVNRDLDQASVLLPAHHRTDNHGVFDIRREKDRRILNRAMNDLAADQLITNDTRSPGSVLMASYLKGYERVHQLVEADNATVVFEKERFPLHREFVGDDSLAVYLKDVVLEIDTPGLGEGVEIADCQGSDSPNPLHLAMIQDYLMIAHLSIYVISSRTGLRQADIRFLSMIRDMGILDMVIFVINCDFSEHESVDTLVDGINKIEADLGLICPDAQTFTFSALYLLMSQTESDLSRRDRDRLAHWCRETELVDFSTTQWSRFQHTLGNKISRERGQLLLKNHLERLEVVVDGFGNWIGVNHDLLTRDAGSARELAARVHHQQQRLDRMKLTVKNTLDGAVNQIKNDLKGAIDHFFDAHADGIVDGLVRFIRSYQVDMQRYDQSLASAGFANTLYMVFQTFKQAIDAYMAQTVNPRIIRFVREQEGRLLTALDEMAGPYGAMIDDALAQYADAMEDVQVARRSASSPVSIGSDLTPIREIAGISLPPAAATMRYSAQIKTEAVMRFGFYKFVNLVKKVLKKPSGQADQELFLALASGIKRMKRETERSVVFHLKDYKENIKFQYMLKLADAAAAALYRRMLERFQYQGADLSKLVELIDARRVDKENVTVKLEQMGNASRSLQAGIGHLKGDLRQLNDR